MRVSMLRSKVKQIKKSAREKGEGRVKEEASQYLQDKESGSREKMVDETGHRERKTKIRGGRIDIKERRRSPFSSS